MEGTILEQKALPAARLTLDVSFVNDGAFVSLLEGEQLMGYIFLSLPVLAEMHRVLTAAKARREAATADPEDIHGDA